MVSSLEVTCQAATNLLSFCYIMKQHWQLKENEVREIWRWERDRDGPLKV